MLCPVPSPLPLVGGFVVGGSPSPGPGPTPTPTVNWSGVDAPIDTTLWASTFYQDRDGTALVTATGQDVRCIRHPVAPNGIIWQSPSANPGNCWRLTIIGGVPYLQPKVTSGEAALDFVKGITSQFFNWGLAFKAPSILNNQRIFSPGPGGGGFYVNHYTGGGISVFNNGGAADFKDGGATAGVARVLDGYIGDGFTTPDSWARFRVGTAVQLLSSGQMPSAGNGPGVNTLNGVRLGGPAVSGFGGDAADVLVRAAYFHQSSNNAGMLSQAKVDEINTWMQALTI